LKLRLVNLEGQVDAAADEHRVAAAAEAERLKVILDDLLSMARSDDGAGDLVEVDVDAVVAERVREWQVVADSREVALSVRGSAGRPALAEGRGLDKLLDALLDNALKFTETGSSVEVTIASGEQVTIAVRDHGPGLRPDELGRATDRFWRSPAHQNVQGSGLGLAIVSRIAQRAGGSLALDLPEGGGLRATVSLPAG
jgi:signal transduction histidine kinase